MSNILPHEAQKKINGFYRARFVLVGSLALFAAALVALLALLPAYAVVTVGMPPALLGQPATSSEDAYISADREEIQRAQILLKELFPIASSSVSGLDGLDAALKGRPKGIMVESLSFEEGKETDTIVVGGTAATREAINAYAAALRADARFANVSVPIGALAGSEGGRFTITLSGNF